MKINFSGVFKIFEPDIVALRDVNFTIEKGEFVYIIGATGSGKSTLLHLITRELLPTRGNLFINDSNLRKIQAGDVPC